MVRNRISITASVIRTARNASITRVGVTMGSTLGPASAVRSAARLVFPDRSATGVLPPDAARRMSSANAAYERLRQALRPIG